MSVINTQVGGGTNSGNRQLTAYNYYKTDVNNPVANWGENASRSLYSVMANHQGDRISARTLINSRLWHGVPQLSTEQMAMFEAAYTGHQFIFITEMPKFMTCGLYANTNLHYQAKNLKAVIERASTGFSGASNITVNSTPMEDGNGRKITHITGVTKEQNNVTLTLHEFAGLPVKNALEAWVTGTYDYKSEHGHYFGNLGIPGGWCLANHTMAMLVVQVDPSWQTIQDAAYYFNMFPEEVPFEHFEWTKGDHDIIDKYSISFTANEERSPMVMYAAERYMNNRILSMVATSVYNSRQFVVDNFISDNSPKDYTEFKKSIDRNSGPIVDEQQYNVKLSGSYDGVTLHTRESAIEEYEGKYSDTIKKPELDYTADKNAYVTQT